MALPASDLFGRTDENPLAGNWTAPDGVAGSKFLLISNRLEGQGLATIQWMYWNLDAFNNDQWAQATLGGSLGGGAFGGVAVRMQSGGGVQSGYLFWTAGGTYQIEKVVSGTRTTLATCTGTPAAGHKLYLEIVSDTLTAKVDSGSGFSIVGTASGGSAFSSGSAGLCGYGGVGVYTLDDFSADNVSAGGGGGGTGGRLTLLGAG